MHVVAAIVGLLSVGLFHHKKGIFHGNSFQYFAVQSLAVVVYTLWGMLNSAIFFLALGRCFKMRVTAEEEAMGLVSFCFCRCMASCGRALV